MVSVGKPRQRIWNRKRRSKDRLFRYLLIMLLDMRLAAQNSNTMATASNKMPFSETFTGKVMSVVQSKRAVLMSKSAMPEKNCFSETFTGINNDFAKYIKNFAGFKAAARKRKAQHR